MSVIFTMVKSLVSITHVASIVGLTTKEQPNGQLRAKCPVSESDDERAIVITPSYNLFNCFACDKGGSQLDLYAHIMRCTVKEAAEALTPYTKQPESESKVKKGFDAEKYLAELKPIDGLPAELCQKVGIGKASKGTHAGKTVIALRDSTGVIIVFASVTDLKLPSKW